MNEKDIEKLRQFLMSKLNTLPKIKGDYLRYKAVIWGNPFYVIIKVDKEGNTIQLFEKPDFKSMSEEIELLSGMHLILKDPTNNHIDWFEKGKFIRKEETNQIPYYLKGILS